MGNLRQHLQADLVSSATENVKPIWIVAELFLNVTDETVRDELLVECVGDFRLGDIWLMKSEVSFFFDKVDLGFAFARAIFHVRESGPSFEVISILLPRQELVHHGHKHGCGIRQFLG